MDRNYIIDYRIQKLIEAGNMVVCAGGNQDLPVIDITRSSRWSYKSRRKFTQWALSKLD